MKKLLSFPFFLLVLTACGPLDESELEEAPNNKTVFEETLQEVEGEDASIDPENKNVQTRGIRDFNFPFFSPVAKVCDGKNGSEPCYTFFGSDFDLDGDKWPDGKGINDDISSIHVYPGKEIVICRHRNLTGKCRTLSANLSNTGWYNLGYLDQRVSSIETKSAFPSKFWHHIKNPSDSYLGGSINSKDIQGLANDGNFWYISNMKTIHKSSRSNITKVYKAARLHDLRKHFSLHSDYNHFGDMDYYDRTLYVPIEFEEKEKASLLATYDSNLKAKNWAIFPRNIQRGAAWVAINPFDGNIYSSDTPVNKVHIYENPFGKSSFKNGSYLKLIKTVTLKFTNDSILKDRNTCVQGGEFDKKTGLLYYVIDNRDNQSDKTGVYAFDLLKNLGTLVKMQGKNNHNQNVVFMNEKYNGGLLHYELEGVTIWDNPDPQYTGNVHVLQLNNDAVGEEEVQLHHYTAKNPQVGGIKLVANMTGYGKGSVQCPSKYVALGGGSYCSDGSFDVRYPMSNGSKPIGWKEHHRGDSSNNCDVYAICAPEVWFKSGEIKVVSKSTGYGKGEVSCPSDYKAISGGSYCSDGDFDVSYPKEDLSGWKEHHRGDSSKDCRVYSVCVKKTHWVAKNSSLKKKKTGYGRGSVACESNQVVIGGGAWCNDGQFDVNYPSIDLKSWKEHHRGDSSNDCHVYATCLTL